MYIHKISVKGRYGWRTLSLDKFFKKFTMGRRLQLVSDPEIAICIDEFGEMITATDACRLLEELEAHRCNNVADLAKFLQVYPDHSSNRSIVEEKLSEAMQDDSRD